MKRTLQRMALVAALAGGFGTTAVAQCHEEAAKPTHASKSGSSNIVDVASKAGSFGTLLAAATAAGFAEDLRTGGPYTVLAPTDAAFAKLGDDVIRDLLKPENRDKLRTILRYHVIAGEVGATDAVKAGRAKTRQGAEVKFTIRDGRLFANDSSIVATDVKAGNGLIHVIDTVLIPPTEGSAKL